MAGLFLIFPLPCVEGPLFCARIHFVVDPELHFYPSLFELVVVSHHALCVDHHPPGHQPGTRRHSKVEPHLRLVNGKLVSSNRRHQVRLPYRVFYRDKEVCYFSRSPASLKHSKRTLLSTGLFGTNLPVSTLLRRWGKTSPPGLRHRDLDRYNK